VFLFLYRDNLNSENFQKNNKEWLRSYVTKLLKFKKIIKKILKNKEVVVYVFCSRRSVKLHAHESAICNKFLDLLQLQLQL